MKAGLIEPTKERRPGPTGSSCGVYRITRDGMDWARALQS